MRHLVVVLLAAACALAGCAAIPTHLKTPEVSFVNLRAVDASVFEQRLEVRLKVRNPNDVELPVRGIDYKLFLMGDQFAEGMTNEPFVLPALGEAEFDMTVTTNFVSSFGRLISRMGGGKLEDVDYELAGTLMVDKGMVRKIPFNKRGTVDFSRALEKAKSGTT